LPIIKLTDMTGNTLPENDRDLQLARRIGSYLVGELKRAEEKDSLLDTLFEYKESRKHANRDLADSEIHSDEIWEKISKATRPKENTANIYQLGRSATNFKTVRAVAASLLIAAFIGFATYLYMSQQPQLIASSSASIQTLTLEDGSRVTLRPYSSLEALNVSPGEHSYKLEGEAFFDVVQNSDRIFSVRAGNGKVRVLGTRFDLSNWGDQTQVYLEEGSIRFENLETEDSVTLSPGEAAEIGPDNLLNSKPAEINEYTDWINRELTFRNKTAQYIFSEMEQEFNISITAPDSVLNARLSGSLSLGNIDESLEDLSLVLDGQFIKDGENSYSFVPER